ncbi:MAG: hypothetical protein FJ254_02380 [Phycisphaerae bacterium]|nr:hypothetical protein [Phycisphaerae bacterium]
MTSWPTISRESALAAGTTLAGTIVVLGMFVVPNYARASDLQRQRAKLEQSTEQYLAKRADLERLQGEVTTLRRDVEHEWRMVPNSPAESRLGDAVSRSVDGKSVLENSVKLGEPMDFAPAGSKPGDFQRRSVRVDMVGDFAAVFDVINSIDDSRAWNRISSIDLRRTDGSSIAAQIDLEEYFLAPPSAQSPSGGTP